MKTCYDLNGFEIRKGDNVMVWDLECKTYIGKVAGIDGKKIKVVERNETDIVTPSDVEVLYDQIKIKVKNIIWDIEDGMDGELPELPTTEEIPLIDLIYDYNLDSYDYDYVEDYVCDWLTDNYDFCVKSFTYNYDRKRETK